MPFPIKKKLPEGSPGEERGESAATERGEKRDGLEKKKPGKKSVAVHDASPNELFMPKGY